MNCAVEIVFLALSRVIWLDHSTVHSLFFLFLFLFLLLLLLFLLLFSIYFCFTNFREFTVLMGFIVLAGYVYIHTGSVHIRALYVCVYMYIYFIHLGK